MRRRRLRQTRDCLGGCGRRIQNVKGVCLQCMRATGVGARPEELVPGLCEWCGQVHACRRACELRAEVAAEVVRLWLYEGVAP